MVCINFAQADAGHTGDGHTEAGHVDDALPTPKPARRRINGVVDTTPPEPEE